MEGLAPFLARQAGGSWTFRSQLARDLQKFTQPTKYFTRYTDDDPVDGDADVQINEKPFAGKGVCLTTLPEEFCTSCARSPKEGMQSPEAKQRPGLWRKVLSRAQRKEERGEDCPCGGCISFGAKTNDKQSEVSDMKKTLMFHGIETGSWGQGTKKSVYDLMWEVKQGECKLEVDPKSKRYMRTTRQLRIKLFADTMKRGKCVLMERGEMVAGQIKTSQSRKGQEGKFITKRMNLIEDWRIQCKLTLEKLLGLDDEEQKQCLNLVKHQVVEEQGPAWAYPGLWSKYMIDEAHLEVVDDHCDMKLGLPSGSEFTTSTYSKQLSGMKEHFWQWIRLSGSRHSDKRRTGVMEGMRNSAVGVILTLPHMVGVQEQLRFAEQDKEQVRRTWGQDHKKGLHRQSSLLLPSARTGLTAQTSYLSEAVTGEFDAESEPNQFMADARANVRKSIAAVSRQSVVSKDRVKHPGV